MSTFARAPWFRSWLVKRRAVLSGGGMGPDPLPIDAAGDSQLADVAVLDWSSGIMPDVNLGVTIAKGKTTGGIVIGGRPIDPFGSGGGHSESTIVDAVRIFIQQGECLRRAWIIPR